MEERRKYHRIEIGENIKYKVCYDNFMSEPTNGKSGNISEGGIFFITKWPPPIMSIIAIEINLENIKTQLGRLNESRNPIELDLDSLYIKDGYLYGEVIRITENSELYEVAARFIRKGEF